MFEKHKGRVNHKGKDTSNTVERRFNDLNKRAGVNISMIGLTANPE